MPIRKRLKRVALRALKVGGAFRLAGGSRWRRRRLLILCYHGISIEDEHEWNPALYMPPAQFERRMQALERARCSVLPLEEALRRLYAKDLPERAVAITFDDGLHDFQVQAYPVLSRYGYPATVYLTTYYCGYNKPNFHTACGYIIWKGRGKVADLRGLIDWPGGRADLGSPETRAALVAALYQEAAERDLCGEARNDLLQRVSERLGFDYEAFLAKRMLHILNPGEVTELAVRGVDVQLHTHRHRMPADKDLFAGEIAENRRQIQELTGRFPSHFCYPSNILRPDLLQWFPEWKIVSATTCDAGLASPRTDPFRLPRLVDTSSLGDIEFESWLVGVAALLPSRRAGILTTSVLC